MKIPQDMLDAAYEQLANDMNCRAKDFKSSENLVTTAKLLPGRRVYQEHAYFFRAASFGSNTVITADPSVRDYFTDAAAHTSAASVFDGEFIWLVNNKLARYGWTTDAFLQYYLPRSDFHSYTERLVPSGYEVRLYNADEVSGLFVHKDFHNALCYRSGAGRRDVLAVTASVKGEIVGMAGASNDGERLWQIGIDVLPKYRKAGIASVLVTHLTAEIIRSGHIPFYGTWWGNIASRRVAAACGYLPAWVELSAAEITHIKKSLSDYDI